MPENPVSNLSDSDLLTLAQQGDIPAFNTLYHRHRDFVHRLALRFTGDHAAALDVSQEAFAYLLCKLPRLKLTGKLSTYLYPIVKNIALSRRRKLRREMPGIEAWMDAGGEFPLIEPDPPSRFELDLPLRIAIAKLPDPQREVLLMRIIDEMSVEEVAAALSIPPGTVKSRLHHALATLRENDQLKSLFL